MRIATWNVNSIRSRIDRALALLERHDLDVLALQETKCRDDQFPGLELASMGYEYAHFGLNQWNGVALISRVGLDDVATSFSEAQPLFGDPEVLEPRAIGATCGGVRVWSLYVPNGRELDNPHYDYKLAWLEELKVRATQWMTEQPELPLALVGDWNIAPHDDDVWDIGVFEGKTHVSAPERAAFQSFIDAGFSDVVRPHTPGPGTYTYWDYTQLSFPKKRGMRIDFILGSDPLAARVTHAFIDREERKGKGASDHAPVIIELD